MNIPKSEPEIVAAIARKKYAGDEDKVPTTFLAELVIHGIRIVSRYRKAHELDNMLRMIKGVDDDNRQNIVSIFCDSKACDCYQVMLSAACSVHQAEVIALQLQSSMRRSQRYLYFRPSVRRVLARPGVAW